MSNVRETIAEALNTDAILRALGLPLNAVYQADTMDSPTVFPFIVLRWTDTLLGIADITRRPFEIWCYGGEGDITGAEDIGHRALSVVNAISGQAVDNGIILAVEIRGNALGRGRDMFDDGFNSLVIPFRALAVARGV